MKIRQSFEQAICILLLIGTREGPMKSGELSKILMISDSYLKKITRQLVVSGIIRSKASKLGGFVLNKELKDISLLDIFNAIEGEEEFIETTHLVDKVFTSALKVRETEEMIVDYLKKAEQQYRKKLQEITLLQIIEEAHKDNEGIDAYDRKGNIGS